MDPLEEGYRNDVGTVEDVDDKTHEVVVEFPYEVVDNYRTDWGRGCWDKSWQRRLPTMVVNHDPNHIIGSAKGAESVGNRARVVGRFADFTKVPRAEEAFSLIKDGHFPGWSYHYRNGRTQPHPSVRGARRFIEADMLEFCPVTFPSIPGANAVGIRSEESSTMEAPTLEQILKLKEDGLTDEEGLRAMLAEFHPQLAEHIRIVAPEAPAADLDGVKALILSSGVRSVILHVDDQGGVSTDAASDASDLASAVDAALDTAQDLFDNMDVPSLPESAQQAAALVNAAGVAVDELLSVMGIDDPDGGRSDDGEPGEGESGVRAVLSAKERNDLPDSAFGYIAPGGEKEDRHFPIHDAAHVRDALARIAQGAKFGEEALPKVRAAAKKFGIKVDDGTRSDKVTEADLARARERLGIK